jgi:hypothetical protein
MTTRKILEVLPSIFITPCVSSFQETKEDYWVVAK